jgi:hypothetical protein
MKFPQTILLLIIIVSCVGVDVQDIVLVPQRLEITDFPTQLKVGDTYQLQVVRFDSVGEPHIVHATWESSDINLATVQDDIITGVAEGAVTLTATYEDLSDEVSVEITMEETQTNQTERMGSLMGSGGYDISGSFRIYYDSDTDKTYLEFIDAVIDGDAPGPYYYLSNATNSVTGGVQLGHADSGDTIYELGSDVTVNTYDVVVVWCDPFSVTLGYGQFDN